MTSLNTSKICSLMNLRRSFLVASSQIFTCIKKFMVLVNPVGFRIIDQVCLDAK